MTSDHPRLKRPSKARTEAQKRRRSELWLARADERRAAEERALTERYDVLKASMARVGYRIGPISDLAEKSADPVARFLALKARVERWDALWSITLRKRATRGKIIIGGAVLAELGELVVEDLSDQAFLARVVALLDQRVPRVRDRLVLRELLSDLAGEVALPLRPGGPPDEPLDQALAILGEQLSAFDHGAAGDDDLGDEETGLGELAEAEVREGEGGRFGGLERP